MVVEGLRCSEQDGLLGVQILVCFLSTFLLHRHKPGFHHLVLKHSKTKFSVTLYKCFIVDNCNELDEEEPHHLPANKLTTDSKIFSTL